ncbi:hypothetical protein UY3_13620 [Chelonia mydas]|uniref:Uncharacterized protein n=1 Tax=Chelonia mydas TaxID=8469 RepID=M7BM47_CHEMY|nr:hypothetical protein UY3_13620 [Chelonia mydas]
MDPRPAPLPAAPIGLERRTTACGSRDWPNLRTRQLVRPIFRSCSHHLSPLECHKSPVGYASQQQKLAQNLSKSGTVSPVHAARGSPLQANGGCGKRHGPRDVLAALPAPPLAWSGKPRPVGAAIGRTCGRDRLKCSTEFCGESYDEDAQLPKGYQHTWPVP